ncbi:hypothetical protein ACXC9Q_24280 [Kribbella sp. CWNU-51]
MVTSTEAQARSSVRTAAQKRTRTAGSAVGLGLRMRRNWQLYAMLALPLIWLAIFAYWPMYGVIIAFKD